MLLGIWKNVEDLESSLSLNELEAVVTAAYAKERRHHEFIAALQGIDLEESEHTETKQRFDEIQRRANAKITGKSEDALEYDELGLDIEVED